MDSFEALVLRGHGIPKNTFESSRPLPEKHNEPLSLNDSFGNFPPEYEGSFTTSTEQSSPTLCNSIRYPSSEDTDGNFTGRSSVFSWGNNDEFDINAASQVSSMFEEINGCLYENSEIQKSKELNNECSDWKTSFPFLRLIGTQLFEDSDGAGTIHIEFKNNNNNLLEDVESESPVIDIDNLYIDGNHVSAMDLTNELKNSKDSNLFSSLHEEVFAIDGEIEEFIAFDNSEIEDVDFKQNRSSAIPPLTPLASIQDIVTSECFDHVWNKIVPIIADLMEVYASARLRKGTCAISNYGMERFLDSAMEFAHSSCNRSSNSSLQISLKTPTIPPTSSSTSVDSLKELMTIRSVPLKERSSVSNSLREDDSLSREVVNRPVSSSVGQYRQFPKLSSFHNAEQQFYYRMMSAKTPNKRAFRLQPLQTPKTASQSECSGMVEVRGTRLQTSGDRPNSYWTSRNGVLPPLGRLNTADTTISAVRSRSPKRNRASSAAANERRTIVRERNTYINTSDSRPNTMHSLRTEATLRNIKHRSRDNFVGTTTSRSLFQTQHSTIDENGGYSHYPTVVKNIIPESDEFVLWGHGPPLLSASQKKKPGNR